MLLSTTPERLEICRLVSQYPAIQKFIQNEVIRTISSGGIFIAGAEAHELRMVIDHFVPHDKDSDIKQGTVLRGYVSGPYTLNINQGDGFPISHSYRITCNSPD